MAGDNNKMDTWTEAAAKELKGKSPDDLTWQTPEGIAVKPLYTAADLEGLPLLVLSDYSHLQQQFTAQLEAAGVAPDVVFESSFSASLCPLIAEGAGIGVLDPLTARAHAGRGVVLRPFRPAVTYELKVLFPAARPRGERETAFADMLHRYLEDFGA